MKNLKTKLHTYQFNIENDAEKLAYAELKKNVLSKIGFPVHTINVSRGVPAQYPETYNFNAMIKAIADAGGNVELETEHLFSNQWSSAPVPGITDKGLRLFNWSETIYPNKRIKSGYWLEQTPEMYAILRNTHKCGYCVKQEPAGKYEFCPHCLDSQYLEIGDLKLTRMMAVADDRKGRSELTQDEKDYLFPLYRKAQIEGATARGKARIVQERIDIEKQYRKAIANAKHNRAGRIWVIEHCPGMLENHIYYDHSETHCFGWRRPVAPGTLEMLLAEIGSFPGKYEIRCAGGESITGNNV